MAKNGFGKFMLGLGLGLGLGVLFAPKSGEENRKNLKDACNSAVDSLKDIDLEEVKNNIYDEYNHIKDEFKDMDYEKFGKITRKKLNELSKRADDLIEKARIKSEPVIAEETIKIKKGISKLLNELADKISE